MHAFQKFFLLSPVRDTRFLSIVQFLSKKKNRLLTDQDLPLKYLFASNLYSSAFTSSSANSPFAFSSAIFCSPCQFQAFSYKQQALWQASDLGGGEGLEEGANELGK